MRNFRGMAGKPGWFRGIPSSKGREVFSGFNISNVYSLIFSLVFYVGEGN